MQMKRIEELLERNHTVAKELDEALVLAKKRLEVRLTRQRKKMEETQKELLKLQLAQAKLEQKSGAAGKDPTSKRE